MTKIAGELLYVPQDVELHSVNITGKIFVRDYPLLPIPFSIITSSFLYITPDTLTNGTYNRPFLSTPDSDILWASGGGAVGYISMFNVSRAQLESYYDGHAGIHWLVPGLYIGAEQYQTVFDTAASGKSASIRIDATAKATKVPEIFATLPGQSNETIVIVSHTDGNTYVQVNGPATLLVLAKYFASLPLACRKLTIQFAFTPSHLAFQRDSDKTLAKRINATYETNEYAMVIALEHMGTRELEPSPNLNGTYGNILKFTGRGEALLWAVGPVQLAISSVINVV